MRIIHALVIAMAFAIFSLSLFYYIRNLNNEYNYTVCFVPGDSCENMISDKIKVAKKSIDVQAYHLTNEKIISALNQAQQRNIKVRVILDKAATKEAASLNNKITVYIDYKRSIAHNKVIIIDNESFGTGSFNFSEAAQNRNVENFIIQDHYAIAHKYEDNFINRLNVSQRIK